MADAPFEVVVIDFLGTIRPIINLYRETVMVATDYLTKWVEAIQLDDQKAETTAKVLIKHVISRHGSPKAIRTDGKFTS